MQPELWEKAVAFHGHKCPGLAIGVRAAEIVMEKFSAGRSEDEELVCVTENDACGVDGIQAVLGCTFGKGNLLYRPTGKQAYSFFDRKSGQKLRLVLRPFQKEMDRAARIRYILEAPAEELFSLGEPAFALPEPARLFQSLTCELCGESAPEHKMRLQDGMTVCLDCFKSYDRGW
jgi:formylmethanofuran dehydrogenase subunit E